MIQSIHVSQCLSTQRLLKDLLAKNENKLEKNLLISTSLQTQGRGRFDHHWDYFQQSLAFSFTLRPSPKLTLTSLEIALLITEYFYQFFQIEILLKWPNDLINKENEKCGGILIHYLSPQILVVGVGINLFQNSEAQDFRQQTNYKIPAGFVFPYDSSVYKKQLEKKNLCLSLPKAIYQHILCHRKQEEKILQQWSKKCLHLNKTVVISEDDHSFKGQFIGSGSDGEAIICLEETGLVKKFYSGHLSFELSKNLF